MEQIEDAHLVITHIVTTALRERASGGAGSLATAANGNGNGNGLKNGHNGTGSHP